MDIGKIWRKARAQSSRINMINNIIKQTHYVENSHDRSTNEVSPEVFMTSLKTITEDPDTTKAIDAFMEDERVTEDNPAKWPVNELGFFLMKLNFYRPAEATDDFVDHMISNQNMRKWAQKYPMKAMNQLRSISSSYPVTKRHSLLARLEKDETYLPHITAQAFGSIAADFFANMCEGMEDNVAIARLRVSPAFQAAQFNNKEFKDFIDHLETRNPVLLQAINPNSDYNNQFTP
ncbi:MAG: hypothetical protein OEY94_05610 [Alphaproteobacteria bacterium]|nr:hypothetical protein [Alphaproteobacteria bacterium]